MDTGDGFQGGLVGFMRLPDDAGMARIDITVDTTSLDLAPVELDTHLVDAVNDLAEMGRARVTEELPRAFDRPSPFTMRGIGTRPASAGSPEATVDVLPQQSKYLSYEILGGIRRAGDYATTRLGPLVPGPDAPLDAYGNLPRNFVRTALRDPDVFWTVLKKGKPPALVRRRKRGRVEILALIIREAHYVPRLRFYDLVEETVIANADAVIARHLAPSR